MNTKDKQKAAMAAGEVATALACPVGVSVADVVFGDDRFARKVVLEYLMHAALLRLDLPRSGVCVVPAPRLIVALAAQVVGKHTGDGHPRQESLLIPAGDEYYVEADSDVLLGVLGALRDRFSPESLASMLLKSINSGYDGSRAEVERDIADFIAHLFGDKSRIVDVIDMTDVQGTA